MKIKKLLSIVMAMVLCFCSLTVVAYAQESTEEVDVSAVYRPLKSFVSFADYGPFLDGIVLKITYSDGTSETVKIAQKDGDPLEYVAGKYDIHTNFFNTAEVRSPGINKKKIVAETYENGVEYSGACEIDYLYIPSPAELIYLFYAVIKIYNPFN
ncbi:MAG: hypothetical protein IJO03_09630 [Clostridia bacterium]|nr:hypothetical protein [Clostridia bacterium]MBQ7122507.1 hypothetical protein [Clostridia bacterium]